MADVEINKLFIPFYSQSEIFLITLVPDVKISVLLLFFFKNPKVSLAAGGG